MKYTYNGRPMKEQEQIRPMSELPRTSTSWSLNWTVTRNWLILISLIIVIGFVAVTLFNFFTGPQ